MLFERTALPASRSSLPRRAVAAARGGPAHARSGLSGPICAGLPATAGQLQREGPRGGNPPGDRGVYLGARGRFHFRKRQKRITIDNEDYYVDLLFFHRKLRRLMAVELKLDAFRAADKGQMELYLLFRSRNNRYYAVFLIMPTALRTPRLIASRMPNFSVFRREHSA